jgi:hypothetical protein
MLNRSFLAKVRSKVNLKFFEYSNSKEYLEIPDIREYKNDDYANV